MKLFLSALMLAFVLSIAVGAAEPAKISINIKDGTAVDAGKIIAEQSGQTIIVDPKIDKKVTLGLNDLELPKILDMLATSTGATWKKVQFAKKTDEKVDLDQLKSSIIALASFPMLAVSVEDSAEKTTSMFAKGAPSSTEAPAVKLPEDYSWVSAYVIYLPEKPADKTASADAKDSKDSKDKVEQITKQAFNKSVELAGMSSEDRQKVFQNEMAGYMTLTPEARQQVLKDQLSSMFNMSPDMRRTFFQDMRAAAQGLRSGQPNGGANPGR